MLKILKQTLVIGLMLSFIGVISASEVKRENLPRDPEKTKLIHSKALIQNDFSGLESKPIVDAFVSWMNETEGDVLVLPPEERDVLFFDLIMKGSDGSFNAFDMDLESDGSVPDPWSERCRQTFYVLRVTSDNPIVKAVDGDNRHVLAFTFTGCVFKFIVVVADRMESEQMMYTTMLHELGHMWGLKDNNRGKASIMNGSWPAAVCITKKDLHDLYESRGKVGMEPKSSGCVSK